MKLIAKTLYGLEKVLAEELLELGAKNVTPVNRAVVFNGDNRLLYKVNYCSATALSVLAVIAEFTIKSSKDLYFNCSKIDWGRYLGCDDTFSVTPVVKSELFPHTGYAGLVLKDAVADWFRNKTGRRPSISTSYTGLLINLHVSHEKVTVSLDSSVVPLYKRGYRIGQYAAPLNEVLAAGMIRLSGWHSDKPLLDPMCGSGTILLEAALAAFRIPPGKFRPSFGFTRWKDFDEDLFLNVKERAERRMVNSSVIIRGSDISQQAISQARINIINAGLEDYINLSVADFKDLHKEQERGVIIVNPPYGERIKPGDVSQLYNMIGTTLKHNFAGWDAFIITSGKDLLNEIGLKPKSKKSLYNGAIECLFARYELYEGTKKRDMSGT
jgi:putative N6-adenine-specific DNA methylase